VKYALTRYFLCSEGGSRTRDTAIMSRLLYHLSYPALSGLSASRAPKRNRTVDLFLTMETLYRLSYGGGKRGKDTGQALQVAWATLVAVSPQSIGAVKTLWVNKDGRKPSITHTSLAS
jgi:hypothetical protein